MSVLSEEIAPTPRSWMLAIAEPTDAYSISRIPSWAHSTCGGVASRIAWSRQHSNHQLLVSEHLRAPVALTHVKNDQ
jgi:hypothetical protein